jgi:putative chitinase
VPTAVALAGHCVASSASDPITEEEPMIQVASLVAAGIGPTQARTFAEPLSEVCARFRIDTPLRLAAFVAQCAHESRLFTALEEGLFYRTPERICAIFKSTVPNLAIATPLARNPKLLANRVYANRNGNRDEASGDGWRYRGRGLIQLTGRANYERAASGLGRPYVDEPDLVLEPADACLTAGWFWDAGNLNALADASRIDAITRAINGPAMAGAAERRQLFETALAAFQATVAEPGTAPRAAPPPRTRAKPSVAAKPKHAAAKPKHAAAKPGRVSAKPKRDVARPRRAAKA